MKPSEGNPAALFQPMKLWWLFCQVSFVYSWDRNNFPTLLCLSWRNSSDCRGGIATLSSNGVQLSTAVYFGEETNGDLNRHSVSQWIEINPGETAAVGYDGDMQLASVFCSGIETSSSQLISPPNPSGSAVIEEYSIEQPEHGGGDCNCLQIYFGSSCTSGDIPSTRLGMHFMADYNNIIDAMIFDNIFF